MPRLRKGVLGGAAVALGLVAWPVLSDDTAEDSDFLVTEAEEIAQERYLSGTRYLRALSLDLRGHVPAAEDYALLDENGEVPESVLDAWLDTPEFAQRVVRFHRQLFWNNLNSVDLSPFESRLEQDDDEIWFVPTLGSKYDRAPAGDRFGGSVSCGDFEASFDEDGQIIPVVDEDGYVQEGWVEVTPYWDPETPIRACAYDAQEAEILPNQVSCPSAEGMSLEPDCGCGPHLNYCATYTMNTSKEAFAEDLDRRVESIILEDRSYKELLLGKRAWVNGPYVHYVKYFTALRTVAVDTEYMPFPEERLPDLVFTDTDIWEEIELGDEQAGIFTSPAYLMRFASNRSRVNNLFNNFYCQPFSAPEGGLDLEGESVLTSDLTARSGCQYCHALIEPAAAAWGRWTPGSGYLDPDYFSPYSSECAACVQDPDLGCSKQCQFYYLIEPTTETWPWTGWLNTYAFLEDRHLHHVDEGPRLLIEEGIADGRIPRCVAQQSVAFHLNREADEELDGAWLDDLAAGFEAAGWDYKELVKAVVTSPDYRRLP